MSINIWGKYKNAAPEIIDTAESMKDAAFMVGEYRMAFGQDWSIWQGTRKDGETRREDGPVLLRGSRSL